MGVPGQVLKRSTDNAQLRAVLLQLSVGKGKQIYFGTELTGVVGSIRSFLKIPVKTLSDKSILHRLFLIRLPCEGGEGGEGFHSTFY